MTPIRGTTKWLCLALTAVSTVTGVQAKNLWAAPMIGASAQILPNGNFENGRTIWTEMSILNYILILDETELPIAPKSGSWAVWLAGDDDELAYIEQEVTIPLSSPVLKYWHWIESFDDCGFDFAMVIINSSEILDTYDLCENTNTSGWVLYSVDLAAFAGQVVTLQIQTETDPEPATESSLFIDDVYFESDGPPELIFSDGFEFDSTFFWSATVP